MKLPGRAPNKADLKKLESEFIPAALATAANLRRVNSQEGSTLIGQRDNGSFAGLVFPYFWPGVPEVRQYRLRRDTPDIEHMPDGKTKELRKYLGAPGTPNMLYTPPIPESLINSNLHIIITEGEKKALALHHLATDHAQGRFMAIALSGVANWRGTIGKTRDANDRPQTEKGPIVDFSRITWEDRQVTLLFDADAATNPAVRYQRFRLAEHLTRLKARPLIAEISKALQCKGIDELLAKHGPAAGLDIIEAATPANVAAEIRAIADAADQMEDATLYRLLSKLLVTLSPIDYSEQRASIRTLMSKRINLSDLDKIIKELKKGQERFRQERKSGPLTYTGNKYEATPTGFVAWQQARNSEVMQPVPICNFTARIVADVARDDGEETVRALKLAAAINDTSTELIISAEDFAAMNWPIKHLGAHANVYPNYKDHVRCAIQSTSSQVAMHRSYTHIGWTEIEGRPTYLHGAGGIAASGHVENLDIDLDRTTKRYSLPEPPTGKERAEAVRESFAVLNIAPDPITFALLGATMRAVIGGAQFSLFLSGQTGSGKSAIAAVFQQFFGAEMSARALPASWSSTANALEAIAHRTKDAVLTVDDFVPQGGANEVAKLNQVADRLLRGQGNSSGRARMTSEANIRAPKSPRGLILATGEDLPRGHSLRARLVVLEMQPDDLQFKILTQVQKQANAGIHAAAMAAFIQYLAANLPETRRQVESIVEIMRQELENTAHKRTPDNLANLGAAIGIYLQFAIECQAITQADGEALAYRAIAALMELGAAQDRAQESGEPCAAFIAALEAATASGAAHMADPTGRPTGLDNPGAWGWREDAADLGNWRPQGARIGWIHEDSIYLEPLAAYKIASANASSGESLTLTLQTLKRRLHQKQLLASTDQARETVTVRRTLEDKTRNVLHFHRSGWGGVLRNPTNPTNPTFEDFGNQADRRADSAKLANVGFLCRVSAAILGNPTSITTNVINAKPANVGFVGFPEGAPPPLREKIKRGNGEASGKCRVSPETAQKPDIKTRHLPPRSTKPGKEDEVLI